MMVTFIRQYGNSNVIMLFFFVTKRIPKDIMHNVPTTLLHSLEGMPNLEWEKLLKLQSKEGSFLFSPSSTAFALMQTKDEKCLQYLTKAVTKFDGGGKFSWWFMELLLLLCKRGMFLNMEIYQIIVLEFVVVPNVYPVDLFEHIWIVDRLQRLGISRYFNSEIKDCVEYIHRYSDTI